MMLVWLMVMGLGVGQVADDSLELGETPPVENLEESPTGAPPLRTVARGTAGALGIDAAYLGGSALCGTCVSSAVAVVGGIWVTSLIDSASRSCGGQGLPASEAAIIFALLGGALFASTSAMFATLCPTALPWVDWVAFGLLTRAQTRARVTLLLALGAGAVPAVLSSAAFALSFLALFLSTWSVGLLVEATGANGWPMEFFAAGLVILAAMLAVPWLLGWLAFGAGALLVRPGALLFLPRFLAPSARRDE